jgi:ppGpp synthetase/RelA/SpoT-type nucleotidyltranferase
MALLSIRARYFLEEYRSSLNQLQQAALEAQLFLEELVSAYPHAVHAVKTRAKSVDSMREKLRKKTYKNPSIDVTDTIGARVITYFAADVDIISATLSSRLEISALKSRDARAELGDDRFGYRSVHLVGRLKLSDANQSQNRNLARRWFEIQIRSILDHAWAEIEHETVYKAGIDFPPDVRRRFRAVAGALEVVENAFLGFASECNALVSEYKTTYACGKELDRKFDVARLMAFMEIEFPESPGLAIESEGLTLKPTHGAALVSALHTAKVQNPRRLADIFRKRQFRTAVAKFAANEGRAPVDVSHRARIILALAAFKPVLIQTHFPDLLGDPALSRMIRGRAS